jgi:hypothetical protein
MDTILFLNMLQTILLLAIAAGTAFLVYRARIGAQGTGTKRSLHTRRREVFGDVVRILNRLGETGELGREELLDFRSQTQDAAQLFDKGIAAYIDEIYARGVKLMSTGEALKGTALPIGEERDAITVENARHTIWLADQIAMVGKKFEHYPDVK